MYNAPYPQFIAPAEVDQILAEIVPEIRTEFRASSKSLGWALAEDLYLDRDQPPFSSARMDGIAISGEINEIKNGYQWLIAATYFAGDRVEDIPYGKCVEIMTGAQSPDNSTAIIPYEKLKIEKNIATYIGSEPLVYQQNIHPKAKDGSQGQLLLAKNSQLKVGHLHALASIGAVNIKVRSLPNIAIVATGNELVPPEQIPSPVQLRASNSYTLSCLLDKEQFPTKNYYLNDDPEVLRKFLINDSMDFPIIITTGACSMGQTDYLPKVLDKIQAQILVHKVRQRPGKPFLLALLSNNRLLFALPGNPISALICYYRYVIPFLHKHYKAREHIMTQAVLQQDFSFAPALTYFLPVRSYQNQACLLVNPRLNHGSGDFLGLIGADGFVSLSEELSFFPEGTKLPYFSFT